MATWRPDPSFYPSPRMAMQAPAERLAYVVAFDPSRAPAGRADRGRHRSGLADLRPDRRPGRDAEHRRRAASLRLERLQLLPVPERAAPACRAALSRGAGPALLAHPHPRHQARPEEPQDRAGDRGRGDREQGRLQPAAHDPLRAGRHLRQRARQRRGQGPGRRVPDGPRELRRARPLGDRPRAAGAGLRLLVASRPRHHGHQRVGHAGHLRERPRARGPARPASMATTCISGTCTSASTCRRSTSGRAPARVRAAAGPRPDQGLRLRRRRRQPQGPLRPRSGPGTATATAGR